MASKTVIIGIDGVPSRLIEDLSESGVMPNFKELKKQGIFKKMQSSIPEISSVAWSSIITGKNAGEHGIFGFTDMIPGTYTINFPNFNSLKAKTFWQKKPEKKYVIINVPSTYPAKELNGFLVSGFVALDLERATYPQIYLNELKGLNYQIDVDAEKAHKSMELFVKELFNVLDIRIKTYRHFWDKENWDVFFLVFTGTDRLMHFLWEAYEDPDHRFHKEFLEVFRKIDETIGEINSKLSDKDELIILSDHGMELVKCNVNINTVLRKNEFLFTENPDGKGNQIKEGTKAFAMDPGRIYLNKEGKYPEGCVKPGEEEKTIQELVNIFNNLEKNGEKIIKKIYRKEEIYHGEFLDKAPDLILLANSGFCLRGNLSKQDIFDTDIFTGKHTQDDAFIFVKTKNNDLVPENPSVEDVVDILNKLSD